MISAQGEVETLLYHDPLLCKILLFLRTMFAADSQETVIAILEEYKDLITRENLMLFSALGGSTDRLTDRFRLSDTTVKVQAHLLGHVHELLFQILWAVEELHCDVAIAIATLRQPTFSDKVRRQQVIFQQSAVAIATPLGTRKDRDIIEKLILATLASWVTQGRPQLEPSGIDAYFATVKSLSERGSVSLFKSGTFPLPAIFIILARTLLRFFVPSPMIRSVIRANLLLFFVATAVLLIFGRQVEWFRYLKAALYVTAGFAVLAILVWLVRGLKRRAMLFSGSYDASSGTITLNASASRDSFRRSVVHELTHAVITSGLFKRDLATF